MGWRRKGQSPLPSDSRSGAHGCGAPPGVDARGIDRPGGPPKLSPEGLRKLVRVYQILNAWYEEDHR